jgi:hypothetical protein
VCKIPDHHREAEEIGRKITGRSEDQEEKIGASKDQEDRK